MYYNCGQFRSLLYLLIILITSLACGNLLNEELATSPSSTENPDLVNKIDTVFNKKLSTSAAINIQTDNDEYVILCTIAGSTFSGAMCARGRQGGVLVAGFAAAAYVLLLSVGSLFVPADANSGSILLKNIIAATVGGVFGGTLRLYRKNKKSKLRR